ncbi:hypothetical protein [Nocardia asiatica]|uniref:hypothetical protein n=1 Tax=Nocardia asiatica TaxID=209252 RepID=UPI002453F3A8|nr:hypothetical protein [Nocardia asiatica]
MSVPVEVHPISSFRANLPALVKQVVESPGTRVYVGAHRKPEAVLLSATAEMPWRVRELLLAGFCAREADQAIRVLGARRGDFQHAGDSLGAVLAWLWRTAPQEAMECLATYLAELRTYHPDAPQPPIRLDDVLAALQLAADFTDDEYQALCARARTDVQKYYGPTDVNS